MSKTIRRVLFALGLITLAILAWATMQPMAVFGSAPTATVPATLAVPSPIPATFAYPLPDNITFRFQGQPPQREVLMRQAVLAAYNYMRGIGLDTDPGPVALWVYKDKAQLIRDLRERFGNDPDVKGIISNLQVGYAGGHMIGMDVLWNGGPGWAAIAGDDWWMQGAVGGYTEVLFENLAKKLLNPHLGQDPYWMIEGGMIYFSGRIMNKFYPDYFQTMHDSARSEHRRQTIRLDAIETWYPNRVEGVVFLGIEYLASKTSDSAFLEYYRGIGRGLRWRDSFMASFGMTVQEFYAEYEAYRLKNYPVFL